GSFFRTEHASAIPRGCCLRVRERPRPAASNYSFGISAALEPPCGAQVYRRRALRGNLRAQKKRGCRAALSCCNGLPCLLDRDLLRVRFHELRQRQLEHAADGLPLRGVRAAPG